MIIIRKGGGNGTTSLLEIRCVCIPPCFLLGKQEAGWPTCCQFFKLTPTLIFIFIVKKKITTHFYRANKHVNKRHAVCRTYMSFHFIPTACNVRTNWDVRVLGGGGVEIDQIKTYKSKTNWEVGCDTTSLRRTGVLTHFWMCHQCSTGPTLALRTLSAWIDHALQHPPSLNMTSCSPWRRVWAGSLFLLVNREKVRSLVSGLALHCDDKSIKHDKVRIVNKTKNFGQRPRTSHKLFLKFTFSIFY